MRQKKAEKILDDVRDVYEDIAEQFSNTRRYFGKEFFLFLPYVKEGSFVVDVGCGNGRVFGFLKNNCDFEFRYLGVDNAVRFIEIAKGIYPDGDFKVGKFCDVPVSNGVVDLLLYVRSFHHIPTVELRKKALMEAKRVLSKNGVLFISVWNLRKWKFFPLFFKAFFRSLFSFFRYKYNDLEVKWGKKRVRYYYSFSEREIVSLLKEAGFGIISVVKGKDIIIIAKNL